MTSQSKSNSKPKAPVHRKPEDEQQERDDGLDRTLADSFPASDPPSSIPDPEDDESAA